MTVKSLDGKLFKVLRQNLEINTGAFPDTNSDSQEDVISLKEPGRIVKIVLQFVRPQKHPTLKDLDFDTLLGVAKAVAKYEVFSAMNMCELRLL